MTGPLVPVPASPGADPFAPRPLPPGDIHLWQASLDAAPATNAVLSDVERARAARLAGRAKARFVRSRELLRRLLAAYGAGAASAIEIGIGAEGKPHLTAGSVRFSLAHTGGLWLAAFAAEGDVGVDVERTGRHVDHAGIAARIFAPAEVEALGRLAPEDRVAGFFRAWTVREALVKARGEGMFTLSARVEVEVDPARPVAVRAGGGSPDPWVAEVPVPSGYAAAVAAAVAPRGCASFVVA